MGCGPKGRRFESCQAYPDLPPGEVRAVFVFGEPSTQHRRRGIRLWTVLAARLRLDVKRRGAALLYFRVGEVSEWLKVPLSKSGVVMSHRGFESHPLRQNEWVSR